MAFKIFIGLLISVILYFVFSPGPYQAQPFLDIKQFENITSYSKYQNSLQNIQIIQHPNLEFPEDLFVEDGYIYTGGYQGKLYKIDQHQIYSVIVQTTGQIMRIIKQGEIYYFLDMDVGICKYDAINSNLQVLVNSSDYKFLDSFALSKDRKIYFSDASSKYGIKDYLYDIYEGKPYGRLLQYDMKTKETRILLDGLYFANGVQLSEDESVVYVAESSRFRVSRYYLKGEKSGQRDIFIENLPGAPDNIRLNDKGQMWIAHPQIRNFFTNYALKSSFIRNLIGKLPLSLVQKITYSNYYTGGTKVNKQGKVIQFFEEGSKTYPFITTIVQKQNTLYLGTVRHTDIAIIRRSE